MARMLPETPDPDAPRSELKVFEALKSGLPDEVIVMHSKRYFLPNADQKRHKEGESDFLVFDPRRGYLVLEVKGGGIERDGSGQWYTLNRNGKFPIQDPGKQAQRNAHGIDRYLRENRSFSNARTPQYHWGVVLPDVDSNIDLGPELPKSMVLDARALRDMGPAINALFDAKGIKSNEDARKAQRAFVQAMAPSCRLVPTLSSRLDDEYPILVRLTEEQMNILDTMADFRRLGIKGGAGTGKTLVAMEKARRLSEDGKRVLYLCYNKPLADYLAQKSDGFVVTTFHSFVRQMTRSSGIKFEPPKDPKKQQAFWDDDAPDLLDQALDAYPDERYDAVIIDEGQDFKDLWWLPIEKLLRDPNVGVLWVFFDPNQNIFGGGPTEALGLNAANLTHNCRNTKAIASYASNFVGVEPLVKAGAPDGIAVQEVTVSDEGEMLEAVRKALNHLVKEQGVTTDRILILSPNAPQRSDVMKAGKIAGITLIEYPAQPGPHEVQFSSLGRFKGLDQDVVILCELKPGAFNATDKHLYVGTSRARLVLIVLKYG